MLSDDARRVLEGAAVAGDPFEPELAAAAAATTEASAIDAIDEFLRLDLVRTTDVPRRFRFRHPLVRSAVYAATPGGWRLGAHERCAEALAVRGATAAARAHHVERSAREGDREAVDVLREAGEGAARLAPASAARWFAEALRLLPENAPAEERVELLLARSGALTAAGHFADSHGALLDALGAVPEDSHALRARVARACAAVEGLLGQHEQAGARLERALGDLPDQGSAEAVALMNELAVNLVWRAKYDAMHQWAERAVNAARGLGDPSLTAAALAKLALADTMRGEPERAEADRSEAAALVDSLSDDELARHLESATRLAGTELYLGRYAEGDVHATRALAVARATGQGELVLVLVQTLGAVWRLRGKLAEAGELLDGGIEASRLLDNTHALVWSLCGRSAAALHAGDVELALGTAREAVDLSAGSRRGLPLGRGSRRSCPRTPGDGATGGRPDGRVRRRRGARADRRRPKSACAGAPDPLLARARPPPRGETRGRRGGKVGLDGGAADGSRLGLACDGGRRPGGRRRRRRGRTRARGGRRRRRGRSTDRGGALAHPRRSRTR